MARSARVAARQASRSVKTRSSGMPRCRDRRFHPLAVRIEDADNLGVGMLGHLAQQVAHVHVVEADAEHAVFRHLTPSGPIR